MYLLFLVFLSCLPVDYFTVWMYVFLGGIIFDHGFLCNKLLAFKSSLLLVSEPLLQNDRPTLIDLAAVLPPGVCLLLLRQAVLSLENHTQDFLDLVHQTDFPEKSLIVFYRTSLNEPLKSQLFCDDPQGSFADFVERALLLSG